MESGIIISAIIIIVMIILLHPHQSPLLQPLSQDSVLRQDVTQEEVILLFLCGNQREVQVKFHRRRLHLAFVRAWQ